MKPADSTLDFVPSDPVELRQAVTQMAACINVADWQFLKLIAEMDRTESWREGGYCNLSNWLDHQCGMGPCAARERIRICRALVFLPHIDEAFRDGVISYSKVRAMTRIACAETDQMLLEIAERSSAGELDRLVKTYERVGTGSRKKQSSHEKRMFEWYYEAGMLIINASIPAEQGALVIKALEKVVDLKKEEQEAYWQLLYEGDVSEAVPGIAQKSVSVESFSDIPEPNTTSTPENFSDEATDDSLERNTGGPERNTGNTSANVSAEATDGSPEPNIANTSENVPTEATDNSPEPNIANICENVSAEAPSDSCLPEGLLFEMSSRGQKFADSLVDIAEHYLTTSENGSKRRRSGHRYEVVLHIDRNQLATAHKDSEPARFYVEPDWGIDEEAARQITCDADVTEIIQNETGDILDYKRRSRIVPARLLRALMVRDGHHCSFPGCSHSKYLEAHHVHHWIDGGETKLENLAMLCSAHHALLHRKQFHMELLDDDVVFIGKDGEILEEAIYPQFPDVSAEVLNLNVQPARQPRRSTLFQTHIDKEIVDMLHFREDWGKGKQGRAWKQVLSASHCQSTLDQYS